MSRWPQAVLVLIVGLGLILFLIGGLGVYDATVQVFIASAVGVLTVLFSWLVLRFGEPSRPFVQEAPAVLGLTILMMIGVLFSAPLVVGERPRPLSSVCISGVKQLNISLLIYTEDYDGLLPAAAWTDATHPYLKREVTCPEAKSPYSYGLNDRLLKTLVELADDEDDTVLLFETESAAPSPYGGPPDVVFRHDGLAVFGFLDGRAKALEQVPGRWTPEPLRP